MAVAKYDTAGNIINRAASELGLGKVADPFVSASNDPNFAQLVAFLTTIGQELLQIAEWRQLVTEFTLTTLLGVGVYALPGDWVDVIPQTEWNRTTRLPLAGPLSSQQWQGLKAWTINSAYTLAFRMQPNEIWFIPTAPPVGTVVAMEYRSRSWVIPNGSAVGNYTSLGAAGQDNVLVSGDICLYDPLLLVRGLKLRFKEEKGFDSTTALRDFTASLAAVYSINSPGAKLSLNGAMMGGGRDRLISATNLPLTGYG